MVGGMRILSICTIPITLIMFFLMARIAGHKQSARKRIYLMGIIMPGVMLLVNAIFLYAGFTPLCGGVSALFFVAGIVLGVVVGRKSEMYSQGEIVVATRSSLPIILWAVSFAVTHLLTTIMPSYGAGIGVALMFLSTGAAIGLNLILLRKYASVRL